MVQNKLILVTYHSWALLSWDRRGHDLEDCPQVGFEHTRTEPCPDLRLKTSHPVLPACRAGGGRPGDRRGVGGLGGWVAAYCVPAPVGMVPGPGVYPHEPPSAATAAPPQDPGGLQARACALHSYWNRKQRKIKFRMRKNDEFRTKTSHCFKAKCKNNSISSYWNIYTHSEKNKCLNKK